MTSSIIKFFFLFTVSGLFISCSTINQAENSKDNRKSFLTDIERPLPYAPDIPDVYLMAVENGTRSLSGNPGDNYWQNEASYKLHAEIDPEYHKIKGRATITYYNNSSDNLEAVVAELAQNLHKEGTPKKNTTEITGGKNLSVIKVNGIELNEITMQERWFQRASGYILDGTRLYLFPEDPIYSGESAEFEFEWTFEVPQQGADGRMGRSRDNLYMIAYWYPQIAVYDDVYGWMDDHFLGNAEFYHKFSEYELSVTAPEGWIVMGTGEFLNPDETLSPQTLERYQAAGESDEPIVIADFDELENATLSSENGMLEWRFYSERVRDVAFSATLESKWEGARSSVGDLNGNGETDYTRINTFYRATAPLWAGQTDYAQHSITFLSEYTGLPYPWPHMTSVEGADIIGGGMEFPMITLMGDYNNAGAVQLYEVTAHELAHMWLPMIVSTNERRYTWIDEGHTSFHTHMANIDYFNAERFTNTDLFGSYLQIAGTDYEGEMMRWSDFHYPGPAYGIASYPKPASVLMALKGVLGEELFLEAHREFIDRWKYKHPYPWDLFSTFEDVSGKNLSWFWRSWYYETWVLDQSISGVSHDDGRTTVHITDLGDIPMPVILRATMADGSTEEYTIPAEYWLQGTRTAEWSFDSTEKPVKVEIDPDVLFPDADRLNNVWEQ